tara:strand:+ start:4400 stop:5980 length:1581 start_codon:yes stop_codon:yes gene_type:complete
MTKHLLFITLTLILLFNCKRKEDTSWDIDVLSPVVKTTLTIDDLVEDSILSINSDNTVDLDYKFSFSPINEKFFLKIPDTIIKTVYGFPFLSPVTLSPGFQFVNDPAENEFDLGDAKINYMEVSTGELNYRIESEIAEVTFYTYTILKTDDGSGNTFTQTISVPAGSRTSPAVVSGTFKFDGYSFDLTGASGNKFNTFESIVLVNIDNAGNPVSVSNLDSIRIQNKLVSLKPAYVRGYLGQTSFTDGPTANNFTIFDQIISGTLDLDSVNIYTELKNYVGAEVQVKMKQVISTNTATGNNVPLTHSSIGNTINLNRAIDNGNSITPSICKIDYTKANSNIDLVIENLADIMTTHVEASLNPLGNISSGNDFLYFDKVIDADFHINLPLKFIANDLRLRQEIELNIDENSNPVHEALISIYAENGFPFDADVQLYLLDLSNNIIDSIQISGFIASAITDIDNKVVSPINSVLKYAISAKKMNIINENSRIILDIIFNTNSTTHTTIYKDYYMKLKLVTDMNLEINYR